VWAPELARSTAAGVPGVTPQRGPPLLANASTVLAGIVTALTVVTLGGAGQAQGRAAWRTLEDFNMDPEFRWIGRSRSPAWSLAVQSGGKTSDPEVAVDADWRTGLLWTYLSESGWYPVSGQVHRDLQHRIRSGLAAAFCTSKDSIVSLQRHAAGRAAPFVAHIRCDDEPGNGWGGPGSPRPGVQKGGTSDFHRGDEPLPTRSESVIGTR
jgi:hypothetical protein